MAHDMIQPDTLRRMSLHELEDLYMEVASALFLRRNRNSVSAKLASMSVGETYLVKTLACADQLSSNDKRNARRRLNEPAAQWTARTTNQGVRVTRVR